jgi:phosphotriesterase-related protein
MKPAPIDTIMTVTGPIEGPELGFCHSHEHLFLSKGPSYELNHSLWMDEPAKTAAELELFKAAGGRSIIEAQPVGCGRMELYLWQASLSTGVHIVASTGFHKLIFYTPGHWIHRLAHEELAELYTRELQSGMLVGDGDELPTERCTMKPGIIKTAADVDGVEGDYVKLFTAAAAASLATGAPIMCHTELGSKALQIVQFLTGMGVSPERIILCHLDRVIDGGDSQLEAAKTGVFLEFDTIGRFKYHDDESEARLIARLLESGYEDKLLLGLDTTRARMKSYGGELGLDYISTSFLPLLRGHGVPEDTLNKFMVINPQRAFYTRR